MEWIERKEKEIPMNQEVLVIWKGRIGILYRSYDCYYCSICPEDFDETMNMDKECQERIDYWMPLPEPIFRKS